MLFELKMHPAVDGDCLQLTWGDEARLHHALIDLGRGSTWKKVAELYRSLTNVELFVMTHVDSDHVAGAVPMAREKQAPFRPARVWFNGRAQLPVAANRLSGFEDLGPLQGEKLTKAIDRFGWPLNEDFDGGVVSVDGVDARRPITLAGGLVVTLLSPDDASLADLLPEWDAALAEAGVRSSDPDEVHDESTRAFEPMSGAPDVEALAARPYRRDTAAANGSSIAFLAEFQGRRVLLCGDAHSEMLERSIAELARAEGGRLRIDLLKVSHHGSMKNTSPAFLEMIDCSAFAFSTDGSRHEHPDAETVARILKSGSAGKKLYFNYRRGGAESWDDRLMQSRWGYVPIFPPADEDGFLTVPIGDP